MTVVNTEYGYLEQDYLEDNYLSGVVTAGLGVEFLGKTFRTTGVQFFGSSVSEQGLGIQYKTTNLGVVQCPAGDGYLENNYLEGPYLAGYICTGVGIEFSVLVLSGTAVQLTVVNYNTNRIRVLCDVESRGTVDDNWTSNSTLASSTDSFNINNVNTDIVEQVWRSNNQKTGIILECDAGVGRNIFLDTFVMLNHNLTTSASVNLIGDDDPAFGSPGVNIPLVITEDRFVYIAPDFPLSGFRYWRISIDDNTNPNAYLQIGVIGFGSSEIMNQNCYRDAITQKYVDHKDSVFTEGFTNVMNERSVTGGLTLQFSNLIYDSQDWNTLQSIFDYAKTTLKCFWIPDPQIPLRFLKFSKLKEIPVERHNYKGEDYVGFTVNLDESL